MADWTSAYIPKTPANTWPTAYLSFRFRCEGVNSNQTFKIEAENGKYFQPIGIRIFAAHHKFSIVRLVHEHSKESGYADYPYIEGPMDAGEFRIDKNSPPNECGAVMMPFIWMSFAVVAPSSPLRFDIERYTEERIFHGYLAGDWVNPDMDYYGVTKRK